MQSKHSIRGFTLLEVLVALLIFAIGLLGLAGLQLKTHQSSSFAQSRTVATLGVSGLVERMRANLAGVTAGNYNFDSGASTPSLPAAVATCGTTGCTAAQMAQNDLREWILAIGQNLPILNAAGNDIDSSAFVRVCQDATPETTPPGTAGTNFNCDGDPNQWTVFIDWSDERNVTSQTVKRYTFTFIP